MKPEWMPINPCPCGVILYPDSHKCNMEDDTCKDLAAYDSGFGYQKKLLEHLITKRLDGTGEHVSLCTLESMLRQLDGENGSMNRISSPLTEDILDDIETYPENCDNYGSLDND
jgi:hypothetical protein